jgi:hypothetical protein
MGLDLIFDTHFVKHDLVSEFSQSKGVARAENKPGEDASEGKSRRKSLKRKARGDVFFRIDSRIFLSGAQSFFKSSRPRGASVGDPKSILEYSTLM